MSTTCPDLRSQSGFAVIAALVVIVVLAGLGAFMVSVSSTQNLTLAQDIVGARTYQATRVEVEWAAYQIRSNPTGVFVTACKTKPYFTPPADSTKLATQTSQAMPALSGDLSTFTVQVYCGASTFTDGASFYVYQITVLACNAASCPAASPGAGYVERQLSATLTD